MSDLIIPQDTRTVKNAPYQANNGAAKADILNLADDCLQRYRRARAKFLSTGDTGAFFEALALKQDRADLLGQVGGGP